MVILDEAHFSNKRLESELVNKWLWEEHRNSLQWRRVRLGPLPTHEMARMYMVTLRFADAIYIEDGYVNIVEAKLKPTAGVVGQLFQYRDLFPQTHEFSAYKDFSIRLILLTPFLALDVVEFCSKHDIKYELWDTDPVVREGLKGKIEKILASQ